MNYSIVLDIALIAILAISAFVMSGKGLFKIIYKIASIVVTIVAVIMFSGAAEDFVASSALGSKINESVEYYVLSEDVTSGTESLEEMPEYLTETVNNIKTNTVAPAITDIIISIVCAVLIYLIVKILLYILFFFVKGLFRLPVLKQVNRLAGMCVGLISGLIIVYIVCAVASINIANSAEIRRIIDKKYLVRYFYDNNLLMGIFIK